MQPLARLRDDAKPGNDSTVAPEFSIELKHGYATLGVKHSDWRSNGDLGVPAAP